MGEGRVGVNWERVRKGRAESPKDYSPEL